MSESQPLSEVISKTLASRAEVLEAYLFGSQARGNAQLHSDVDIAVFLDPNTPLAEGFGIDCEIATDLMVALQRNDVDIVVLNRADPLLYHRVLRDGIRILARNLQATTTREGMALSRYCDYVPQLEKIKTAQRLYHPEISR